MKKKYKAPTSTERKLEGLHKLLADSISYDSDTPASPGYDVDARESIWDGYEW